MGKSRISFVAFLFATAIHSNFNLANAASGPDEAEPEFEQTFTWKLNPGEVCLRLASPGDILMGRDFGSMHYGPVTPIAAAFDVATLTPFTFKNPHTGLVMEVRGANASDVRESKNTLHLGDLVLKRRDFMPDQIFYMIKKGKIHDADRLNLKSHTGSFAVLRFKKRDADQTLKSRVAAVEKLNCKTDKYSGHGLCSNYVDYVYQGKIHRWWNQIPIINTITENWLPILNIKTPSALASSPQTEKICEVSSKNNKSVLKYPQQVSTHAWVTQLVTEGATGNPQLKDHSELILKDLQKTGIISRSGRGWKILYKNIRFQSR